MTPPSTGNSEPSSHEPDQQASPPDPVAAMPHAAATHALRSVANHRSHTRIYPWLLLLSTGIAALFCFMYITKPVMPLVAPPASKPTGANTKPYPIPETSVADHPAAAAETSAVTPPTAADKPVPPVASMLPDAKRLPGDSAVTTAAKPPVHVDPRQQDLPVPSPVPTFEETNVHIQHVLTAAAPGGDLSRIVLNVPVLYQSRNLRWTASEVDESRELLKRLATYQENSRALREEGTKLLAAWNHLVELSIPTPVLRADSPSLPANQDQGVRTPQPAGLDTTESIQIQPADK